MKPEVASIETLPTEECLRLLREHIPRVGRVGFVHEGAPVILPVNYRMVNGQVVFRTDVGTALETLSSVGRARVAFEVDALDPNWREGWSVLVQGAVIKIVDDQAVEDLRHLPLQPWAPGARPCYLRIEPYAISGRRII